MQKLMATPKEFVLQCEKKKQRIFEIIFPLFVIFSSTFLCVSISVFVGEKQNCRGVYYSLDNKIFNLFSKD